MSRFLCIDYGSKRVGLAISDKSNIIAKPYKTLINKSENDLFSQIEIIIRDNNIKLIVIGLPLNMSGKDTSQTKSVRKFKETLHKVGLPIVFEDERLSSVSAKNSLIIQNIKTGHNKSQIDKTAAAIILQQFLDKSY